jgi:hypothetical protein
MAVSEISMQQLAPVGRALPFPPPAGQPVPRGHRPHPVHPDWLPRTAPFAWVPVAAGACLLLPALASLNGTAQWATVAAIAIGVVWSQLASLAAWVGSDRLLAGDGDTTLAEVLRHKRHAGWRILRNPTLPAVGRVHHIAVGPGGVVVVETKWRRNPTADDLEWAAARAQRVQRATTALLRPVLGEVPVVPVIVTSSSDDGPTLPAYVGGVRVLDVDELAVWLDVFDTPRLNGTRIAACHALLVAEQLPVAG